MTDNDSVPTAQQLAAQWKDEHKFIADRLAFLATMTDTPPMRFRFGGAPLREFRERFFGEGAVDGGSPMVYAPYLDRLYVDPVMMFGKPGDVELDDPLVIAGVEGLLLHELAHRRDRFRIDRQILLMWIGGPLIALMFALSLGSELIYGSDNNPDAFSQLQFVAAAALLVVSLLWVWFGKRDARASRIAGFEIAADDYAADVGGLERWDPACNMLAYIEAPDPTGIYLPVERRRERQYERRDLQLPRGEG